MYHYKVNDDWVSALISILRPSTIHWEYADQLTAHRETLMGSVQHILSTTLRWLNSEWNVFNAKIGTPLSALIDDTILTYTQGEPHHFIVGKSDMEPALTFIETVLREDLRNIYSLTNDNLYIYQYDRVVMDATGTYVILEAIVPIPHHKTVYY